LTNFGEKSEISLKNCRNWVFVKEIGGLIRQYRVSCPYCLTMFEDGLKSLKADDKVQVMDVAEIVSRGLK